MGVGPLVPNRDSALIEVFDIGVAAQEPEQFVNDRFEMKFFRGQEWKTILQREPCLRPENRICAGASAVFPEFAFLKNEPQKLVILQHRHPRQRAENAKLVVLLNVSPARRIVEGNSGR